MHFYEVLLKGEVVKNHLPQTAFPLFVLQFSEYKSILQLLRCSQLRSFAGHTIPYVYDSLNERVLPDNHSDFSLSFPFMPYCLLMFDRKYMLQYCVTLSVLLKILYTHISGKHQINLPILLPCVFFAGRPQVIDSISSPWQVDFKHFLQTEEKNQFAFGVELFLKYEPKMKFGLRFVQLKWWWLLPCSSPRLVPGLNCKAYCEGRHKTNLKVLLINNVLKGRGGVLMICNPAIMASK